MIENFVETKKLAGTLNSILLVASERGWKPKGWEAGQRTTLRQSPGVLRFNTETMVRDSSFLAIFLNEKFLKLLVGDLWEECLLEIAKITPAQSIDYLSYQMFKNKPE